MAGARRDVARSNDLGLAALRRLVGDRRGRPVRAVGLRGGCLRRLRRAGHLGRRVRLLAVASACAASPAARARAASAGPTVASAGPTVAVAGPTVAAPASPLPLPAPAAPPVPPGPPVGPAVGVAAASSRSMTLLLWARAFSMPACACAGTWPSTSSRTSRWAWIAISARSAGPPTDSSRSSSDREVALDGGRDRAGIVLGVGLDDLGETDLGARELRLESGLSRPTAASAPRARGGSHTAGHRPARRRTPTSRASGPRASRRRTRRRAGASSSRRTGRATGRRHGTGRGGRSSPRRRRAPRPTPWRARRGAAARPPP